MLRGGGLEIRGSLSESMSTWCEVARDATVLQFRAGETPSEGGPNLTGCLHVHTDSVDAVYEEIHDKVSCDWGVEERAWGARELVRRDLDGCFITFTQ